VDQLDQIAVSGRVRTADGAPIESAAVTLTVAGGRGEIAGATTTGADGSFRLAHPPEGQYTLAVAAAPSAPVAVQVAVGGRAGPA
jgi:putative drug exporter of the RND superfamily